MKILKHIFSKSIWIIVAIYALIMIAVQLPVTQAFLGSTLSTVIAQKLGTEVTVGSVDLGLLNRIILNDVVMHDQQGEQMLSVGKLSAKIEMIPLLHGQIRISSAQLFGAQVRLYQKQSSSPVNIQFVLDSLASKDTTSHTPLDLHIGSFIMRRSSISFDKYDEATTPGHFNINHLKISDISTHIALKNLTDDSLHINIKRLSFHEQSGLHVNRLSLKGEAGRHNANISTLTLQLPHSMLHSDVLTATYDAQRLQETIQFQGSLTESSITTYDLACFLPELKEYTEVISLASSFSGTASSIQVDSLSLNTTGASISLQAHGWAKKTDRFPLWHADIQSLSLSSDALKLIAEKAGPSYHLLENIGRLHVSGAFDGLQDGSINTSGKVDTGIGDLTLQLHALQDKKIQAHLETEGIEISKLLNDETFGQMATVIDLSGDDHNLKAEGTISHLDYKDYTYQHIELNGNFSPGTIIGKLKIDDTNMKTDVEGKIERKKDNILVRMTGYIHDLAPKALHWSDQWGDATFSAIVDADINASNINDAQGSIDLDDFVMTDSLGTFQLDNIHLKTGYENNKHFLKLTGDMGEALLRGQFDWNTLPQSFINYIGSKLPTLPGLPAYKPSANDFDVSVHLLNSEWISRLFNIPLSLNKPVHLNASINDLSHEMNVDGWLPAFTYAGNNYRDARINLSTPEDTMKCDIRLTKFTEEGNATEYAIRASASGNNLSTSFNWNNPSYGPSGKPMRGQLNTIAQLYNNELGRPEAHLIVLPSHTLIDGAEWNIETSDILYSDKRIVVDHLSLERGDQHIYIEGIGSESPTDTLTVDLNEIDVAYVLNLVDFHSVEFSGSASGKAHITQLFGSPDAWAHLTVGNFLFEEGRMGTLHADVQWNKEQSQIDISALADDGPDAQTHIHGYVSPTRNYIDLDILGRGTYIEFMQSFASSFLSHATGHATGDLKLAGPLSNINLTGQLVVDGEATVTALGTTYQLRGDTVRFIPDDIQLNAIPIYDRMGNVAYLSGGIHHEHLTRLTFDLDVQTDKLLGYEFHDFGDQVFYGTVLASGNVDLHGRPGEVVINCNVTPLSSSSFTYNAASTDAISQQEFITWRSPLPTSPLGGDLSIGPSDFPAEDASGGADIYLNLLVNTTPDAEVRLLMDAQTADYITLHGSGVIRASFHNKGAFQMFGTYTVERGTYGITIQNIIKKNFLFQEGGTLVFGGNPMDATINLQALYTVNGVSLSDLGIGNSFTNNTIRVNCLMNIMGQAGAPRVEFDLDMPTVNSEEKQMIRSIITSEQEMNQQVLYLLGIGRFYTQGANNANTQQQYGQTELAMQSFLSGTLSTQINEVISQVIKNDQWNFGANISTGTEGWHNAAYEGLVSGRMLNNRLLINGQFGYRDNATQATPSFIGDFDLRYLLYPNGNLALKVYNQTNDRYFTRSSLNTQGIGLIVKRDFNGLSDLFRNKK